VDRSWDYINRSQTHDVEIGTEAPLFPEKEYISGIFLAVWYRLMADLDCGEEDVEGNLSSGVTVLMMEERANASLL
jgi:hypothetical protein